MFNVTIEATTLEELKEKLVKLTSLFVVTPVTVAGPKAMVSNIMLHSDIEPASPDETAQVEEPLQNVSEMAKSRKKPGRPSKKVTDSVMPKQAALVPESTPTVTAVLETEAVAEEPVDNSPLPSREQVISALQEYNVRTSMPEARALLGQFGCTRISDLQPHQYRAFISACQPGS